MVVQGHVLSLLDEEEDKAVVLITLDGNLVKILLEMIRVCRLVSPRNTQRVDINRVHLLDDLLAHWVLQGIVQEINAVVTSDGFCAHLLY